MAKEKKQILSLSEVCEEYGLKRSWIYFLVRKKRIPHYKPNGGRTLFFKRDEVESFLLSTKIEAQ